MKTLLALAAFTVATSPFGAHSPSAGGAGIEWQPIYEDALGHSAAEGLVTFVAVNMDGERANDSMAEEVYEDKRIVELTGFTVNLVASNFTHTKKSGACPRFGTITCAEHRRVDVEVRGNILEPDDQGYVVAPQHVWLDPQGEVLLSVPYGITTPEMEWCFVAALKSVDPDFEWKLSSKARAPKRLVMKGVAPTAGASSAPPTRKEALEILEKLKRGVRGAESVELAMRLAQADESEARDYLLSVLRASPNSGRRGGGGFRGGGGEDGEEQGDRRTRLLRWIGTASPPSYWEVCAEFISSGEELLRAEAVVALEQLAAPESLKVLRSAVTKEKDPQIKKNLLRAIGAAGGADSKARKLLLKQAGGKRNELWKRNAIIALGSLAPHDDVSEFLTEGLAELEGGERLAVLLAMAFTRDVAWLEVLEPLAEEKGGDAKFEETLASVIAVLKGSSISSIREVFDEVSEDELPRDRIFPRAPGGRRGRGEE